MLGEQRVQAGEVAGRRLDVQGGTAGVRDQVVGSSSRYAGLNSPIGASNLSASRRTVGQSHPAKYAKVCW